MEHHHHKQRALLANNKEAFYTQLPQVSNMQKEKNVLRTDVDDFLELVKEKKSISLIDAAKELNTPLETVQAWADFLVEEKIIGIEYKFTTPYVFIEDHKESQFSMSKLGFDTKEHFYEKARKRNIQENHIRILWVKYLNANKESMKQVFVEKGQAKGIPKEKLPILWQKYYEYLTSEVAV